MRFYALWSMMTVLAILMAGCGNSARDEGRDEAAMLAKTGSTDSIDVIALEMPAIPSTISEPEDRAGFIAIHFWDGLDFTDTARSMNQEFMEQNFVDYLSIMPAVMASDRQEAFDVLLKKASVRADTREMILNLGNKYLAHPESPMKNAEFYRDFLDAQK